MIARIAWFAVLAAVSILSFGVNLDRQSIVQAELAPVVPHALRGVAQERLAERALLAGQNAEALALARELVLDRPMPAENLTLLGQAQIANGEERAGIATVQAATSRGWRAVATQLAVATAAIDQGRYPIAANRLTAVMATNPQNAIGPQVLRQLLALPEGRADMVDRLANPGRWQQHYIRYAYETVDPADLWSTIAAAEQRGVQLTCAEITLAQRQFEKTAQAAPDLPERCRD